MSVLAIRGGIPVVWRSAVSTTGQYHKFPWISNYLIARAATDACRLFFTEDDYTNDTNYVEVPVASASTPNGEWSGPVEASGIWVKSATATSNLELVIFQRRG